MYIKYAQYNSNNDADAHIGRRRLKYAYAILMHCEGCIKMMKLNVKQRIYGKLVHYSSSELKFKIE